jgi:hypothetical protein
MNKNFKLGKKAKRTDPRTFKLSKYLIKENLPQPPSSVDWTRADDQKWPMFLNDQIGTCALASPAHQVELWTANAAQEQTLTDADVMTAYEAVGKFNPADPLNTDNGCALLDVMNYWRQTGIGGHKILAFVEVNPDDKFEVQVAMWLFGGLSAGFTLPRFIQDLEPGAPWHKVPNDGGVWGGHAVNIVASGPHERKCVTWGAVQSMSKNFFQTYCDELYAVLSQDWIGKAGLSPSGFDMVQLQKDLSVLHK